MRVIEAEAGKPIYIGHEEDNESLAVRFDVSELIGSIGDGGEFFLRFKRGRADDAYPIAPGHFSVSDDVMTWVLADEDLTDGVGEAQIRYVNGEKAIMSCKYTTVCHDSLGDTAEIPEAISGYIEYLEQMVASAIGSASEAEDAAARAEQAAASYKVRIEGTKLIIG